jgi:hypothetical protein
LKRSTPLKRSGFRREGPSIEREPKPKAKDQGVQHKAKECDYCGNSFLPLRPTQKVCGPVCAGRKVRADKAKGKQELRARKAALKTIPDLIKEAQREFNAYIRLRDAGQLCVCCGRPLGEGDVGGAYDAGHYRSTGSASHLRFDERNCHGQRKQCNRYGAGRAVDYRIGLIARIGLAEVEALEADNTPRKWTREELIAIRDTYKAKRRELEKNKE